MTDVPTLFRPCTPSCAAHGSCWRREAGLAPEIGCDDTGDDDDDFMSVDDDEFTSTEMIEAASRSLNDAVDVLADGFYAARRPADRAVLIVVDTLRVAQKQLAWLQRYHGEEL